MREAGGDRPDERLHRPDIVVADGEEGEPAGFAQHDPELCEEGRLLLLVRRVGREDLLELVEHQHLAGTRARVGLR